MNELEKNQKELEDIEYAIDNLDGIINDLKAYKQDCSEIVEELKAQKYDLEYIADELRNEIDEISSKLMAEHYNEVIAMNSEGVDIAKENQAEEEKEELIDTTKVEALKRAIKSYKISDAIVGIVLASFNYAKLEDIKMKDYILVCNALSDKK